MKDRTFELLQSEFHNCDNKHILVGIKSGANFVKKIEQWFTQVVMAESSLLNLTKRLLAWFKPSENQSVKYVEQIKPVAPTEEVKVNQLVPPGGYTKTVDADGITTISLVDDSGALFRVYRGGQEGNHPCTKAEMLDFLDACGIEEESFEAMLIESGSPFEIDGEVMRFERLEKEIG